MIVAQLRLQPSEYRDARELLERGQALDDIEKALVDQDKIRVQNAKYEHHKETPYCRWLDTTPTYRIRKALAGLKLPDSIVEDKA